MHFHACPLINSRYYYLAFRAHQMPETSKENAVTILERAKLENWVLGTTKVMQTLNGGRLCSKCNKIICGKQSRVLCKWQHVHPQRYDRVLGRFF